ncbi:MAG: hypothetical protein MJY55_00825 [Bacteroidales bacterium]|nr:hypothetical protein [Bacteroidales bacterium]
MKKYRYIVLAGVITLAVSCTKDVPQVADTTSGEFKVLATMAEFEPEIKTTIGTKSGSTYPVSWEVGDILSMNGVLSTPLVSGDLSNEGKSANFTFTTKEANAPFNFIYPGTTSEDEVFFDGKTLPMYATSNDVRTATFSYLGAVLKFSFKGTASISNIYLKAADASKSLYGNFTIGMTSDKLNGSLTPSEAGAELRFGFPAIQLSSTAQDVFVIIPAGTYEGGITAKVIDTEGGIMEFDFFTTAAAKTITAGKVYEFPTRTYGAGENLSDQGYFVISDLESLLAFKNKTGAVNSSLKAIVTCDIDATGYGSSMSNYYGELDGCGHTISGLTNPMFGNFRGTLKNLTLNSTLDINNDTYNSYNTNSNNYGVGIFADYVQGAGNQTNAVGYVYNCVAEGSINVSYSTAYTHNWYIGGICGANSVGTLEKCVNKANITIASGVSTGSNELGLGGVCGINQAGSSEYNYYVLDCVNEGNIETGGTSSSDNKLFAGGVVGKNTNGWNRMAYCVNKGNVKIASTASCGSIPCGGVVGYSNAFVRYCSNTGNVGLYYVALGTSTTKNVLAGGVVGYVAGNIDIVGCSSVCTVAGDAACGGVAGIVISGKTPKIQNTKSYSSCRASNANNAVGLLIGRQEGTGSSISDNAVGGKIIKNNASSWTSVNSSNYSDYLTSSGSVGPNNAYWNGTSPVDWE